MTFAALVSGSVPAPLVFVWAVSGTVMLGRLAVGLAIVVRERRRKRKHGGTLDLTGLSRGGPRVFVGPKVNAWEVRPPYRPPLKLVSDESVEGVDCSRGFTEMTTDTRDIDARDWLSCTCRSFGPHEYREVDPHCRVHSRSFTEGRNNG